jgi:hypothetical protein
MLLLLDGLTLRFLFLFGLIVPVSSYCLVIVMPTLQPDLPALQLHIYLLDLDRQTRLENARRLQHQIYMEREMCHHVFHTSNIRDLYWPPTDPDLVQRYTLCNSA